MGRKMRLSSEKPTRHCRAAKINANRATQEPATGMTKGKAGIFSRFGVKFLKQFPTIGSSQCIIAADLLPPAHRASHIPASRPQNLSPNPTLPVHRSSHFPTPNPHRPTSFPISITYGINTESSTVYLSTHQQSNSQAAVDAEPDNFVAEVRTQASSRCNLRCSLARA